MMSLNKKNYKIIERGRERESEREYVALPILVTLLIPAVVWVSFYTSLSRHPRQLIHDQALLNSGGKRENNTTQNRMLTIVISSTCCFFVFVNTTYHTKVLNEEQLA